MIITIFRITLNLPRKCMKVTIIYAFNSLTQNRIPLKGCLKARNQRFESSNNWIFRVILPLDWSGSSGCLQFFCYLGPYIDIFLPLQVSKGKIK